MLLIDVTCQPPHKENLNNMDFQVHMLATTQL
jgi:hypothetical protein